VKLFEFEPDFEKNNPLRVATVAALSRVKAEIEDTAYNGEYKVDALLKALRDNGVRMNHEELIKVSKKEPWSNIIANIEGDNVIFKGDPDSDSSNTQPDQTSSTMDKMAKRAAKKQEKSLK
jgi:hypothetical protein